MSTEHLGQRPSYVIGADGRATAVLVDIKVWRAMIERLENTEDRQILQAAKADLDALAQGQRPAGWKSWEEFEAELDTLETAGELSA